ncbi:major capsid protein [Lichenihabitans sp. PAMC28606]|uniref:major capsid protein n=1 Tax=Lichenihabitans sp. PAMC28606 TaxID=2880932 RepID=UPI001D0B419C|nr:major capsid protein [Lichenihabitans sp. PAMC28606]UDL95501.1 major capsid protein [Lichenihabitans sp. PAMC28606]
MTATIYTRYSTTTLLGILYTLNRPKRFLLETFFPREQTFDTAQVVFDEIISTRRLAPFVSPLVKGKPQPTSGEALKAYKPPYVKPKHALDPSMPLTQYPGESINVQGGLSPRDRMDRLRVRLLQEQDDQITRREEWMAAQLLLTGTMNVVAEDHPPMNVDLGRPTANTIVLTGQTTWGSTGVSPYQMIQDQAASIASATGFFPNQVVMDPKASRLFLADPFIQRQYTYFQGPPRTMDLAGKVAPGSNGEAVYLGSMGGFDFWQYQHTYSDTDGTTRKVLPDNTVIMGSVEGGEGVRAYGAILDFGTLMPMSRYPKEWMEEDPSSLFLMTQSAPLPLLGRPEATCALTVA